jgi:hypothetical protein
VRIRAKSARGVYTDWITATVLPLPPIVNPDAKDIGVKFGLAAPASGSGYTPAQVRQITDALHMYAQAGMAGSFGVGDYFDLNALSTPAVTVKDAGNADMEFLAESLTNTALTNATYTGYTDGAQLRFHVESIDGYLGKNGNTAHHIVFKVVGTFISIHGERRIHARRTDKQQQHHDRGMGGKRGEEVS